MASLRDRLSRLETTRPTGPALQAVLQDAHIPPEKIEQIIREGIRSTESRSAAGNGSENDARDLDTMRRGLAQMESRHEPA